MNPLQTVINYLTNQVFTDFEDYRESATSWEEKGAWIDRIEALEDVIDYLQARVAKEA